MSTIIRFLKRIYVFIFNKFKDFRSLLLNNSYFFLYKFFSNNTKVINLILYTFVGIISYFFLYDLTSIKVIKIFIFTLISLAVSMYILDNYTFSNNIFIKILQKLVFLILKLSLIVFILEILDLIYFTPPLRGLSGRGTAGGGYIQPIRVVHISTLHNRRRRISSPY